VELIEAKVVLVTWGGVGYAEALQLASEGPLVVITGRRSTALLALAEQNPNVAFVAVDAASPLTMQPASASIQSLPGPQNRRS
jgi:NADP-dependent 3-hydroxy acid dehydrogenase YdfG